VPDETLFRSLGKFASVHGLRSVLFMTNSRPGCSDGNLHDLLLASISWHGISIFALVYVRNPGREGVACFES